jgi:hypothetical protein
MDRRQFLTAAGLAGLGALLPGRSSAIGDASRTTIARMKYAGEGWDVRGSGIRRLLQEVDKRTSISVDTDYPTFGLGESGLFEHPFVAMMGDRDFDPLPTSQLEQLRTYLKSGGFMMVDASEGVREGPFYDSVERMLGRTFPDRELRPLPTDHVLYKSFYLIDTPVGRIDISDDTMGIFGNDRLYAIVHPNDLFGALAQDNFGEWRYSVRPGGEQQRERAFRLGINLVMYALCVNYKSDQVHVPFILKRRKWKVD